MKLFMFYVGGDAKNSNIELHDVRFSVGDTAESCYDDVRAQWWGTPDSLHLDCWGEVEQADGYDVTLSTEPYTGSEKLYFVNLGGYDPTDFSELHKNVLVVSESESKAKVKALKMILDWNSHHKDNMFDVEKALCLNDLLRERALFLHLTPAQQEKPFQFICKYKPLS